MAYHGGEGGLLWVPGLRTPDLLDNLYFVGAVNLP